MGRMSCSFFTAGSQASPLSSEASLTPPVHLLPCPIHTRLMSFPQTQHSLSCVEPWVPGFYLWSSFISLLLFLPYPICSPIHSLTKNKRQFVLSMFAPSTSGGYSMFQLAWTANLIQHGVPLLRNLSIGALLDISVGIVLVFSWLGAPTHGREHTSLDR